MTTELPDAAWYATHIMQKPLHELCEILTVALGDGEVAEFGRAWDPLTHDADALQLLDHLSVLTPEKMAPWWELQWHHGRFSCTIFPFITPHSKLPAVSTGENAIRPLAICRAVYAWWLAQQGETKA